MRSIEFFERVSDPNTNTVEACVSALLKAFDGDPYKARCAVAFSSSLIVADSKYVNSSNMTKERKDIIIGVKIGDIKYLEQVSNYLKVLEYQQDKSKKEDGNQFDELI